MTDTLAERLKLAMAGPPRISQAALAKACSVSAPSVSDWCRGVTKSLDGVNLVRAAAFLKVRPRWLSEGLGPRELENPYRRAELIANEPGASVITTLRGQARRILEQLPDHLLEEAMNHMEWLIERDKKTSLDVSNGRSIPGRP